MELQEKIKIEVNKLRGLNSSQVVNRLKMIQDLNSNQKNLIYLYLFPRPLLHMELPVRINEYRKKNPTKKILIDEGELGLFLEAYKTNQYNRFMKHLIYSYIIEPCEISPIIGINSCHCELCKKEIYENELWLEKCKVSGKAGEIEKLEKYYLAFQSNNTKLTLCAKCIVHLKVLKDLIDELEPNSFFKK